MASDGLQPRRPLHITVNSGSGGDLLESMRSDSSRSDATPGTPGLSRQLIPQSRTPSGQNSRFPGVGPSMYGSPGIAESTDSLLLPPARSRGPRSYHDSPLEGNSRTPSAMSSRRTSWSSDTPSRDSRLGAGPFASP